MAGTGGVWRAGWRLLCHPERSNGGLEYSNGSEEKRGRLKIYLGGELCERLDVEK